jgi:hypothetical protein
MLNRRNAVKAAGAMAFGTMLPIGAVAKENDHNISSKRIDFGEKSDKFIENMKNRFATKHRQKRYEEDTKQWLHDYGIIASLANYLARLPTIGTFNFSTFHISSTLPVIHDLYDMGTIDNTYMSDRTFQLYTVIEHESPNKLNWYRGSQHHSLMLAQLMAKGDLFCKYEYHDGHDKNYFQFYSPESVFAIQTIKGKLIEYQIGKEIDYSKFREPLAKNDLYMPKPGERYKAQRVHPDNIVHMKLFPGRNDQYGRSLFHSGIIESVKRQCSPSKLHYRKIPWFDLMSKDIRICNIVKHVMNVYAEGYKQQVLRELDERGHDLTDVNLQIIPLVQMPEWKELSRKDKVWGKA